MTTTQISLPGQAHVAEGPHDQTGMYLMHHAFRRDLARFESAVRRTPVASPVVWRALAARWDRFGIVLHHHHTIEDESIWPVLVASVDSPEDTATLAAMAAEHRDIDPALAGCTEAFAAMAGHPCEEHRAVLQVRVSAARSALLDHLRHEETEALPLLQRVMTDQQFAAAEAAAAQGYPLRLITFLVPWLAEGVPSEVVGRFLAQAGPAYGAMLRVLRGPHARRERRAFRHA